MQYRIANTFTNSLTKLQSQEQKLVKTTAFDLQVDPSSPSHKFHRINRSKDPNFWSVRVSHDIRMIVHKTEASLLLCYVDHHDNAYAWAERRKIERHPKTGAAQLVELRESIKSDPLYQHAKTELSWSPAPTEIYIQRLERPKKMPLFSNISDDDLLGYGVPPEWLDDVKKATEDSLFDLADHLPQEASEALLDLAVGATPEIVTQAVGEAEAFDHPDAQRRFRLLTNVEELERALEFPWEKWTIFLHPVQRQFVERDYNGPARVAGSAGTGKTIVALHRAVFLARKHPKARVLLTTYSKALSNALKTKLDRLIGNEPEVCDRILVRPITGVGYEIYSEVFDQPNIASSAVIKSLLKQASTKVDEIRFTPQFLFVEWANVVDAWQLRTWVAYRDVSRLGRKTRVGGKQREILWSIFEEVRVELERRKVVTWSDVFGGVTDYLENTEDRPFDFAVIDEAQDIGVAELRFLSALGVAHSDSLFFTGDLGQRIFQQPFSWKSLGVDVRGRSHRLRVNYRTSHQIRSQSDRLLPSSMADVDGNVEVRRGTVSVFNGPAPTVRVLDDPDQEATVVGEWIADRLKGAIQPQEIGVFVRADGQLSRARAAVKAAGAKARELSDKVEMTAGHVTISTMHLAKGLEFRAVAVMACDDEILPLQERIETVSDDSELEEAYNTERYLLYVACTRARDHLLVTGVAPASEFLDDFMNSDS